MHEARAGYQLVVRRWEGAGRVVSALDKQNLVAVKSLHAGATWAVPRVGPPQDMFPLRNRLHVAIQQGLVHEPADRRRRYEQ
jgi:hypothetical protein